MEIRDRPAVLAVLGPAGISARRADAYALVHQVVAVATNIGSVSLIRCAKDQVLLGFCCGLLLLAGSAGLLFAPGHSLLWLVCVGLDAGVAVATSLSLFALRAGGHQADGALPLRRQPPHTLPSSTAWFSCLSCRLDVLQPSTWLATAVIHGDSEIALGQRFYRQTAIDASRLLIR
jgi:hypothetical protein